MEGKSLYDNNILEQLAYSDDYCQCRKKSRVKHGKMKKGTFYYFMWIFTLNEHLFII